jgi:hypothetical protein
MPSDPALEAAQRFHRRSLRHVERPHRQARPSQLARREKAPAHDDTRDAKHAPTTRPAATPRAAPPPPKACVIIPVETASIADIRGRRAVDTGF